MGLIRAIGGLNNGSLYSVGSPNAKGEVYTNYLPTIATTITFAPTFAKVTGWGDNTYGQALSGNFLSGVTNISAGYSHSLGRFNNGKVTGWGFNDDNQALGGNSLTGVIEISAGESHSLALLANGKVTGWGSNSNGVALSGNNLTGVIDISAGKDHSLALFGGPSMSAYQVFVSWN